MRIAVLICSLVFDSQKAFMKGVERRIRDWNDVCCVFCCHMNANGNNEHTMGEFTIFDLPTLSTFDGVIFVKNVFGNKELEKKITERIIESKVPCVCVDSYQPEFVNIISDESGNMARIVKHLVKTHECKKIYYLGGHKDNGDNILRFKGFRDALAEHGLEFDDSWAYFGNYQYTSGVESADYFLNLSKDLPDAIACANDEMAVGLCTELKRRGIKVPKNIKVTGIDYDSVSRVYSPQITTIKRQQYQKGVDSVNILHEYKEHTPGETITANVVLYCGETCGCTPTEGSRIDAATTNALAIDRYYQSELTQYIKKMTAQLVSKRDYDSLIEELKNYTLRLKPSELYLCLNVTPDYKIDYADYSLALQELDRGNAENFSEEIVSAFSCVAGNMLPDTEGEYFERADLFPPSAKNGKPGGTYYFFPIHYLTRNFGYAILGDDGVLVRNDFFPNWCTITGNALENSRIRYIMEQMISALDRMWIYDTLTGLYNRAGFFKMSEFMVNQSIQDKSPICVIFIDVDGLKKVNDLYGHDEGDILIKGISGILKDSKRHGEIIMRYGGDEFVLLAPEYDDAQAENCIKRIETAMDKFNETSGKPYKLEASIGYCITVLNHKDELNALIENADQEMYKNKTERKIKRGEAPR